MQQCLAFSAKHGLSLDQQIRGNVGIVLRNVRIGVPVHEFERVLWPEGETFSEVIF